MIGLKIREDHGERAQLALEWNDEVLWSCTPVHRVLGVIRATFPDMIELRDTAMAPQRRAPVELGQDFPYGSGSSSIDFPLMLYCNMFSLEIGIAPRLYMEVSSV